jgi:hypothetical protein
VTTRVTKSNGKVSFDNGETWHTVTDMEMSWSTIEETRGGEEPGDWKVACEVIPVVKEKDSE